MRSLSFNPLVDVVCLSGAGPKVQNRIEVESRKSARHSGHARNFVPITVKHETAQLLLTKQRSNKTKHSNYLVRYDNATTLRAEIPSAEEQLNFSHTEFVTLSSRANTKVTMTDDKPGKLGDIKHCTTYVELNE